MSCLKDGRIFVDRTNDQYAKSYLLTPNPGQKGKYEEVMRPTTKLWHKLSISPDETKVAYMLDNNRNTSSYEDVVICYADFDVANLVISNQVQISELNMDYIDEYPRWNQDGSLIIYDSNRSGKYQLYVYRMSAGVTEKISKNSNRDEQFGNFENCPK